jgi:hypothetical protein
MKYLALAVLLAVMQTPPSVPRKAADGPTATSQNVGKDRKGKKNTPAFSTIENSPKADSGQGQNQQETSRNEKHSVTVSELPPVSVSKDRWDKLYIVLTAILVLIGSCTFIAIWIQAIETKKAARAALLNAQAVINAERAWLDIGFSPVQFGATIYCFYVFNLGKTPAFITERLLGRGYWSTGENYDVPIGFPGHVESERVKNLYDIVPPTIMPEKPTLQDIVRHQITTFDTTHWGRGGEGQSVTYHGHVSYRDIFGQEHRTEVVYKLTPESGHLKILPKYTRYVTKTKDGEKVN